MRNPAYRILTLAAAVLSAGCGDLVTAAGDDVDVPRPGTYLLTSFDLRPLPDSVRTCGTCEWFIILPDTLFIAANLAVDWRFSWDPGAGDPRRDILQGNVVQAGSSVLITGTWLSQPTGAIPQTQRLNQSAGDRLVLTATIPGAPGVVHTLGFQRAP